MSCGARFGHYRRVVPAEQRPAFGCSEVVKSLGTASRIEAERLEKPHDVEFEARLRQAKEISDPHAVAMRIADSVPVEVGTIRGVSNPWGAGNWANAVTKAVEIRSPMPPLNMVRNAPSTKN